MKQLGEPRHKLVAAEVRAALSRAGYIKKDLAQFFGISAPSAGDLWNGKVPYSLDRLDQIAAWLDVPLTDLLGDLRPAPLVGPERAHAHAEASRAPHRVAVGGHGGTANSGWRSRSPRRLLGLSRHSDHQLRPVA